MKVRALLFLIAVALVMLGVWLTSHRPMHRAAPAVRHTEVPIQEGKTIDFSSGQAVVKDDPAQKAAIERGVTNINAAAGNVTFGPKPAPDPAPTPAKK